MSESKQEWLQSFWLKWLEGWSYWDKEENGEAYLGVGVGAEINNVIVQC